MIQEWLSACFKNACPDNKRLRVRIIQESCPDVTRIIIDISCIIPHLDRAETQHYIESHLDYASGRKDIFTDKAVDDIYKVSTGIPRRINHICDGCLMYASQQNKRLIDEHQVQFVIEHEMLGSEVS